MKWKENESEWLSITFLRDNCHILTGSFSHLYKIIFTLFHEDNESKLNETRQREVTIGLVYSIGLNCTLSLVQDIVRS